MIATIAPTEAAADRARDAYNAAADHFDHPALGFWDRAGQRTVSRLGLRPGMRVLDVACGTGASALPAAESVGPNGLVLAVDLAERLLETGRSKARARGLTSIHFRPADMENLGFADLTFDAVICVFGIFFAGNMERQLADLWRLVKPDGVLAITTWGPRFFAPMYSVWQQEVRRLRPDLDREFNPWDRITTRDGLARLFHKARLPAPEIEREAACQEIDEPEDLWRLVLGTGLRWTVEQMGPAAAQKVRQRMLQRVGRLRAVETNVIYAVARRR